MPKKIWEVCPSCGRSVRIHSGKPGRCDACGAEVLPCSACTVGDCNLCPYRKKDRRVEEC